MNHRFVEHVRLSPRAEHCRQAYLAWTYPGVGSFGTRVLFAKVGPKLARDRTAAFMAGVAQIFREHGLLVPFNPEDWTPHVTLLKTSKWRGRGRAPPIRAAAYGLDESDTSFGAYAIPLLELCAMQGDAPDGFYPVEAALALTEVQVEQEGQAGSVASKSLR